MKAFSVTAERGREDKGYVFTVRGQTAKSLLALVEAGDTGATVLETVSWALRFSAHCFDLRHNHNLSIRTNCEQHEGGWHGRHILVTPVEIVEIIQPKQKEAA